MPLILHAYHISADGKATKIPGDQLGLPRPEGEGHEWYHLHRQDMIGIRFFIQPTRIVSVEKRPLIVKDQLTDLRAEQINKNMMILAVVSAIFLPLGLFSGMMGINVGGMPLTENGMGFWYVTGIVITIGLIQMIIF